MRIVKLKRLLCALAALWLLCGPWASAEAPSPTVTLGPTRAIANAAVRDVQARAQAAGEAEAEDDDEPGFRESLLMILVILGIIALLVFDSRHGWNITLFLLRCVVDALLTGALSGNHDSGGRSSGRGGRASGGGGRFTGGGAGRGR